MYDVPLRENLESEWRFRVTREEFESMVTEYGTSLFRFCCRCAGSREEAEDLYQDTFLTAMECRERIKMEGNPKSYLFGIATRLWKNRQRKAAWRQRIAPTVEMDAAPAGGGSFTRMSFSMAAAGSPGGYERMPGFEPADFRPGPEDMALAREQEQAVLEAAASLPQAKRLVLYLYYTAELTTEDIAALLKIPRGTVKSRLSQARKEMRHILEGKGYGE